jgi:hypothetical protein
MIDRKSIEERLAELKRNREQLLATLNAYAGAIEDCEHWMKHLDESERARSNGPGQIAKGGQSSAEGSRAAG